MLNSLKNWFLYKLIRVLDNHYERLRIHSEPPWWTPNLCEPTVQLALRDLCRPGDIAFDVGANYGHLSVLLSRLVGPKGIVCSFEASPRNLEPLQSNLNRNGCGNARVVHAAVSAQSGAPTGFFYGHHSQADQMGPCDGTTPPDAMVNQLALDDFVEHFGIDPAIVKMDIEGAEYAALQGFRRSLDRLRPILVLETGAGHRESIKLLLSLDYRVIDLCNYRELESEFDFPPEVSLSNVLCLPRESTPPGYESPINVSVVQTLNGSQFRSNGQHSLVSQSPVELPPGRYVFEVEFDGTGDNNCLSYGLHERGITALRYVGSTSRIRSSYRHWTWHCHRQSQLELFFEFLDGQYDPTFKLHRVKISHVANLDQSWLTTI